MQLHKKTTVLALASLLMAACSSTPLEQPTINYADSYVTSSTADNNARAVDALWWQAFALPALNTLMQSAQLQSPDLLIVAARVEQAELQLRIANASWFPSLSASASSGESRSQQAALLPLELQARQTQSALAILLGKTPQEFTLGLEPLLNLQVPVIAAGTPVDIVTRRPDLAASEAELRAANADIDATRAALLPGISLSASAGLSTSALFNLNPATQTSGWTLSLAQTLFNGGRLMNQKRLSETRQSELLLHYHKAILTALQEVDNALISADISQRLEASQQKIVENAERSLQLTEARYRAGTDDLLSLLDAQRSLFQVQDALVQQCLARLTAAVALYKSLGGGWQLAAVN